VTGRAGRQRSPFGRGGSTGHALLDLVKPEPGTVLMSRPDVGPILKLEGYGLYSIKDCVCLY
jgi:hypothetical protein